MMHYVCGNLFFVRRSFSFWIDTLFQKIVFHRLFNVLIVFFVLEGCEVRVNDTFFQSFLSSSSFLFFCTCLVIIKRRWTDLLEFSDKEPIDVVRMWIVPPR
uniref:Ynl2429p n=1 Tax=Saccharomyces cerevisiae TaxID=4932 RepID=E9P9Z2_YEASX|nr:Ynl2429p [Saccharomyces cerevisiae]